MAQIDDLTQQVNLLTAELNVIKNNSKNIEDLTSIPSLTSTSELMIRDLATTYKTSIQDVIDLIVNGTIKTGFLNYNDSATATTPISITGGGGFTTLTNDALGSLTNTSYPPTGITNIWDSVTNSFDFSELSFGDMVEIRFDAELTTTVVNTEIIVELFLGTGVGSYTIPFITANNYKTAGTYKLNRYNGIYIVDSNTRDNPAYFKLSSDQNCTVKVNGWYCKINKRV